MPTQIDINRQVDHQVALHACVWEVRRGHVLSGYWRISPPHNVMATITEQLYSAFLTQDYSGNQRQRLVHLFYICIIVRLVKKKQKLYSNCIACKDVLGQLLENHIVALCKVLTGFSWPARRPVGLSSPAPFVSASASQWGKMRVVYSWSSSCCFGLQLLQFSGVIPLDFFFLLSAESADRHFSHAFVRLLATEPLSQLCSWPSQIFFRRDEIIGNCSCKVDINTID